jgi:predicted MPP superfamily phosphohydrolase
MQTAIYALALGGAVLAPVLLFLLWRVRRKPPWRLAAILALPYAMAVWGFLIEPRLLVVRHVAVMDADWHAKPLRIGVIADTHVPGPNMSPARVARIVARLNAERPDIVVLLGDYVGGHDFFNVRSDKERAEIAAGIEAFARLRAPLGLYAVLGNHDTWYGDEVVRAALLHAGVTLLDNEGVAIAWGDQPVWLAGLGDITRRASGAHVDRALANAPPGSSILMIAHWPDVFAKVPARVALTLVGHTHCGQVNLPLVGRLIAASPTSRRYACGLYDDGGRKLYVSGGVGTSMIPVRFNAPPEIAIVTISPEG